MLFARRNAPFQYVLSAKKLTTNNQLTLHLHRSLVDKLSSRTAQNLLISDAVTAYQLNGFHHEIREGGMFGAHEAPLLIGQYANDRLEVAIPLPNCELLNPCEACDPPGELEGMECFWCDGSGTRIDTQWDLVTSVSVSVGILLDLLMSLVDLDQSDVISPPLQLLTVQSCIRTESGCSNAAPLGGSYSAALADWLATACTQESLAPIGRATRTAAQCLQPSRKQRVLDLSYHVYLRENAWFGFSTWGDRCTVHPAAYASGRKLGEGFDFESHNVDSAIQQLSLFAGLAALHDLAVEAGVGQ